MRTKLTEILEECLERITRGESKEVCPVENASTQDQIAPRLHAGQGTNASQEWDDRQGDRV